jgi:hypothetical protein
MPEEKDLKTRIKEAFVAVKQVFKPAEPKKELDQKTLEKELEEFIKINDYNAEDPDFDMNEFQNHFMQYLKDKNYSFAGVEARLMDPDSLNSAGKSNILPKNIRKISDEYNICISNVYAFEDTTQIKPGMVVYVVTKIDPNRKKPWVTYKPTPRIITQVHDSGVNGGTIFFTYDHNFIETPLNGFRSVVSEDHVIYSPLTRQHADYICTLLNAQSRILYRHKMKKLAIAAKQNTK